MTTAIVWYGKMLYKIYFLYSCSQCEYKSNDETTLKSHIEQNHDETEWQISTQELIEDSRTRRNLRKAAKS